MSLFGDSHKKLGFGMMRLPLRSEDNTDIDFDLLYRMVDRFLERGFTYFDTAYPYHSGHSETAVRRALVERHPRDRFLLANKLPIFNIETHEECHELMDEQLQKCGVDYFDFYLLHNLWAGKYDTCKGFGGFDFMQEMKRKGTARAIGFSFHDRAEVLDKILTEQAGIFDFIQLQVNYTDWESPAVQSRQCIEVANRHHMPFIVMEPIKGGGLANPPEEVSRLFSDHNPHASAASWAIRFAATVPGSAMVLSGMSTLEQVEDNTAYMTDFVPLSDEELRIVHQAGGIINAATAVACTACQYCVDGCPQRINIPALFSVYNFTRQFGSTNFPAMHYSRHTNGRGRAGDCISCGACEASCPQHLPIIRHLGEVSEMFDQNA